MGGGISPSLPPRSPHRIHTNITRVKVSPFPPLRVNSALSAFAYSVGGNHVCPRLPACHPAHVSCHRQHTAPEESGGSSRAEGAGISLGLAAEAQPQHPPWVPLEQAQTGSSCQSRDKSLNHPNPRLLCYPKPSPTPSTQASCSTPAPCPNLLSSFGHLCERPPERLHPSTKKLFTL